MIKALKNEIWKPYAKNGVSAAAKKYMVSNLGRVAVYSKKFMEDGSLLSVGISNGYQRVSITTAEGRKRHIVHRMIAASFVKPKSKNHVSVIHLNYNTQDNKASNLQWATYAEVSLHSSKHPNNKNKNERLAQKFIDAKKGKKLKLSEVIQIKKLLANPNRKLTYTQIAAKYGISEKAISRIKTGENWGLVTV